MSSTENIGTIIQARMGSSRLPGKIMKPLAGRPMIDHVIKRANAITPSKETIVAIPDTPDNNELEEHLRTQSTPIYRGPENDVLQRYYECANVFELDHVVRITGDCPMLSPTISTRVTEKYLNGQPETEYASNTQPKRTYPNGYDTQVFSYEALEEAHQSANDPSDREHVGPYIIRNRDQFPSKHLTSETDYSDLRLTVDYPEDYELAQKVFRKLYTRDPLFELEEILNLFQDYPQLKQINRKIND